MRTVERSDEGLTGLCGLEKVGPPSNCQQLARENGGLRAIIAELLITNQKLRWKLGRARAPERELSV
jgi:hypothetical protein